jgi:hydrogenase 3 maturation protease
MMQTFTDDACAPMTGVDALRTALQALLHARVCLFGVGNRARGDDGAGSVLAERLRDTPGLCAIDAGTTPENFLEPAVRTRPGVIVIADAADLGGEPGDWRILDPVQLSTAGLSTHALSLNMAAEYFALRTPARVVVLGIQPATIAAVTGLSDPVSRTVQRMCDAFRGTASVQYR